ncbi:hypothetical protein RRG08_030519 [Elysia crispata]|uniref:ethanolamine-phosphate cytidylyltransferase n=1 Tax=Elysia crispata TaxID=231223 RepID=A0AAE1D1F4_9GAST|nr:hypothetical protein RRG08_030519 [Elysia crispata]
MSCEGKQPYSAICEGGDGDKQGKQNTPNKKPVRVWMDGSFDMLHIGHITAMHKARALGDCLIVGAQSDADVQLHKGPPVHPEEERFRLLQALKCVDQFVGAASYGTSVQTLDKHGCDFCVHGDDATLRASDTDPVFHLMKINRARLVPRELRTSTTDQIERILKKTGTSNADCGVVGGPSKDYVKNMQSGDLRGALLTASIVHAIFDGRVLEPRGKVVYVDGAFDLFNVGHLSFLEKAAQEGSYLLVGVHDDAIVSNRKGYVFPVLTMLDRAVMVLSLKCVSDVVFGAPAILTQDFLDHFKIDLVCRGKNSVGENENGADRYCVPKKRGIFKLIDSGNQITSQTIVSRIVQRRAEYVARNQVKNEKEEDAAKKLKDKSPAPQV